mgnify:CR=1 FL=1
MKAIMEEACRFFERHLTGEHLAFLLSRYGFWPAFAKRCADRLPRRRGRQPL